MHWIDEENINIVPEENGNGKKDILIHDIWDNWGN